MSALPTNQLQIQTLAKANGTLEVFLAEVSIPAPNANEVVVRIEAAPINLSDLGLMFGAVI
jgi:NADPH:quinone reductase-like Zn-dependent oxidoreductase